VADALELGEQELARIMADVLALCDEYRRALRTTAVWTKQDRAALDHVLQSGIPEEPVVWEVTREILQRTILASQAHLAHPRFLSFVSSPNNFVSSLGDLLASVHNSFAGSWLEGSGAQTVERAVTAWFAEELGLPASSGGVFLSGGSISNLTALVTARQARFGAGEWRKGTVYFSDQAHSSVARAARILGFSADQIRIIPADDNFRLPAAVLKSVLDADKSAGWIPLCVVASAGTTNTGAIDPLADLSRACQESRVWLHVDGAYGGAAALCEGGKTSLQGLHLADSITLDPHKWLFQPFACSCLLVRDATHLRRAFHTDAEYLQDADGDCNLWDYGPELTRPFRALKVWLSLQVFGAAAFRRAIAHGIHLACYAELCVRAIPVWQLITPASLGIVTFRYAPPGASEEEVDKINGTIAERCLSDGFAFVVTTKVTGRTALRLCTINPRTTEADIAETLDHLRRLGEDVLAENLM
jgi:aromatic-L-amino-acid/L-tryptophan decarboxylase